jgi:hypothetical protein
MAGEEGGWSPCWHLSEFLLLRPKWDQVALEEEAGSCSFWQGSTTLVP